MRRWSIRRLATRRRDHPNQWEHGKRKWPILSGLFGPNGESGGVRPSRKVRPTAVPGDELYVWLKGVHLYRCGRRLAQSTVRLTSAQMVSGANIILSESCVERLPK